MLNKAYKLRFNNGAPFWRVYVGDTGLCVSEHRSNNGAKKKVKRMNKRIEKDKMKATVPYYDAENDCYGVKIIDTSPIAFGDCKPAPTPVKPWTSQYHEEPAVPKKQKQGNNPMNYDYNSKTAYAAATITQADPDATKRQYVESRLQGIYYLKDAELESTFSMTDDPTPKTPKEMLQRIKDGKFKIAYVNDDGEYDENYDEDRYFYASEAIRWRDPAKPADYDGYKVAREELSKFRTSLVDIVKLKPVDTIADTIKALEDWQPTGKAN